MRQQRFEIGVIGPFRRGGTTRLPALIEATPDGHHRRMVIEDIASATHSRIMLSDQRIEQAATHILATHLTLGTPQRQP
jgi:hypothetical protein